jgi:hypothetical protein
VTRRAAPSLPAAAWAVPAVAVLVFVQLGYGPASHSIARGSAEVLSATARGSIPGGGMARLIELTANYGLAALPLLALALVGLVWAFRRPESVGGRAALRFLHVPALVYLGAVFGLVAVGAYSGSHRYLYPALPALALLAAAALDRQPAIARLGAAAAGALLAVGFLPVFASFASDNAGLVAAGKAVADSPGLLVTDSPVAAYYSRKPLLEIAGSQALPPGREQAIEWMRIHGVTDLVFEGISYYRASLVFPDLASGHSNPPFAALGQQSSYQVVGGKPVYAYRLGAGLATQSIYPGVSAVISPVPARGKTAPLAKGLALRVGGVDSLGEGMGFGVPMVHYPDGWVYSRTVTTVDVSTPSNAIWKRTFELDEIGVDAAHGYQPIGSRGRIEVTYTVDATGVLIDLRVLDLAPGYMEMGILNEQSASFDDFADQGHTLVGSAFHPSVPVSGSWARLRSATLDVEWSVPAIPGANLYGGRELIPPTFDWAGLDYMFEAPPNSVTYHINVQAAQ